MCGSNLRKQSITFGPDSSLLNTILKSVAPTKGADADYDSTDDFMLGKLVQVTFGCNHQDLWKAHVSENSEDDFM